MSPYTVEWTQVADDQLIEIWIQAPDRGAVTAAEGTIQKMLSADPLRCGTAVSEGLRKITVTPLTAYYDVEAAQNIVVVRAVAFTP